MNKERFISLQAGNFYHIYNRGNNKGNIFYTEENYRYFLTKYDAYLSDYLETYAYCLLPNHFHLLIKVKDDVPPLQTGTKIYTEAHQVVSESFRRFFTSYSKSINKQEGRAGSLFQKNFKRKIVDGESYFSYLIYYIHANPQRHQISDDYKNYPHSSYNRIFLDKPSKLQKQQVISWFGSKEEMSKFHAIQQDCKSIEHLIIEEE